MTTFDLLVRSTLRGLPLVCVLGGACSMRALDASEGTTSASEDSALPAGLAATAPAMTKPEQPAATPNAPIALDPSRNIGSPLPDPTGITFDGEQLWLINGGHNARKHRLVRFDDTTLTVTRDFSFDDLIEELGTGVYGLAWDGKHVWISVSGNRNKLVAVDPQTGAIVRTLASPTNLGPSDLEFDGARMWIGDGTGTLFSMDLATGGIDQSFAIGAAFVRDEGVAVHGGRIVVNSLFGEGIATFTTAGALIGTQPTARGPMCNARGQIVSLGGGQIRYDDVR